MGAQADAAAGMPADAAVDGKSGAAMRTQGRALVETQTDTGEAARADAAPDTVAFKRLLLPARAEDSQFFRADWTLNLYRGCNHGCVYCDSRSVCYHLEDFGRVRVKRDCLAALEAELRARKRAGVVSMGAASDAYNAREATLGVTRGALLLLRRYGYGVALSTKSALIARDADILGDLARQGYVCAAFSVTTADPALAAFLEPGAPPPERRFEAMAMLARSGVVTGTWLNPMLPYLTDTPEGIREVLKRTADAGGRFAICHFALTLREGDREYFYAALENAADPLTPRNPALRARDVRARYVAAFGLRYVCPSPDAERLQEAFNAECDRLGLLRDFASVNRAACAGAPAQTTLF